MNQLTIINQDGKLLVDSREVAEMVNKRHDHLIRDIDGYVTVLIQNPNLGADEFFILDYYKSGTGKAYKRYLLTKKGCDMVANKMTGEKGVLFTATYVTQFEEMEKQLQNKALPQNEAMAMALRQTADMMDKLPKMEQKFDQKIEAIDQKVEKQITLTQGEQRGVQRKVALRVYMFSKDKEERRYLFAELYRDIKDRWKVPSYRDVLRQDRKDVVKYINAWVPKKKDEENGEIA
ncbi:Rha family transcriptional regulator [Chengkuizengella marina]|uniref:Rha family transcriptional regulator n=1 Tax=Chengkuizengella marina TaxID=2507566 RepID=UPI00136F81E8|nr:Rha family transcriptional regulator [Chengkuizengella marina]